MIDVHCHMEQKDYNSDRDKVIEDCKKHLDAIITSCANPLDLEITLRLVKKYKGFVFATLGIHPSHIDDVSDDDKQKFTEFIKNNSDKFIAIGEVGLDYHWIKDERLRKAQREMFSEFIELAKQMKKPLVVHTRNAIEDTLRILEEHHAKDVHIHLYGDRTHLKRIMDNEWKISVGPILLKSKTYKKIVRDTPIENIMLETDSPWFGENGERNTPCAVKKVAEKIAEIKGITFKEVDKITTKNARKFFQI